MAALTKTNWSLPSQNLKSLAAAADEFLEEGFDYPLLNEELRRTAPQNRAEAIRKLMPPRKSLDGYFVWLRHLIWLEGILEVAPNLELTAAEAQSMVTLRQARSRFQRTHPPCPHCGMPNGEHELICRECMKEITR